MPERPSPAARRTKSRTCGPLGVLTVLCSTACQTSAQVRLYDIDCHSGSWLGSVLTLATSTCRSSSSPHVLPMLNVPFVFSLALCSFRRPSRSAASMGSVSVCARSAGAAQLTGDDQEASLAGRRALLPLERLHMRDVRLWVCGWKRAQCVRSVERRSAAAYEVSASLAVR